MSSSCWLLRDESRDFSHAEKKSTACKAEQIHKMTSIFPQKHTKGLILCSKKKILGVELCDFSQAEKEITACKAEQIHRMTSIFTQNDIQGLF